MANYGIDTEEFVDAFTEFVNQWKLEREQWEKGSYANWGMRDNFKIKIVGDLEKAFELQNRINIVMLHKLEELQRNRAE